ncbi:hypothetical protein KIN20_007001 [Parelaphostrongylus tenuis]|uniref:Uncharacterized protein n=1 Tax=Parelaphostrongylus tenuis TaxID=148309 RepID=A0AAD5MNZ1_PARTN|nr:hypothetical protein KIN20_007001 [Parelaphostrongylus tenuis]
MFFRHQEIDDWNETTIGKMRTIISDVSEDVCHPNAPAEQLLLEHLPRSCESFHGVTYMSRHRFCKIMTRLHAADNDEANEEEVV